MPEKVVRKEVVQWNKRSNKTLLTIYKNNLFLLKKIYFTLNIFYTRNIYIYI